MTSSSLSFLLIEGGASAAGDGRILVYSGFRGGFHRGGIGWELEVWCERGRAFIRKRLIFFFCSGVYS